MTPADLFAALFDFALLESALGASDDPTPRQKAAAARSINGAIQEMRKERASAFGRRTGWTLRAAQSGTVTIDANGHLTDLGGMTLPNDGCTIRFGTGQADSRIYRNLADTAWVLDVPYAGGVSTTASATIYHDAVVLHRGKERGANQDVIEGLLGEVAFDRRPLTLLPKGLTQAMIRNSTEARGGDYGRGLAGRLQYSQLPTGSPLDCWTELQTFDAQRSTLLLRVAPLPATGGTLEARVIVLPAPLTATDFNVTSYHLAIPGGMDETVLLPLAIKRWIGTPFCKPSSAALQEINRQYSVALNELRSWRAAAGASGLSVAAEA